MSVTTGRKIESVAVISNEVAEYCLGGIVNELVISNITDNSVEWENGIDFIYRCWDQNEKLIAEINNCPTVVRYIKEDK